MPNELTIGEVASRSGVAPSALRFYEEEGLIASRRTTGNQRRYERAVLRRVALIQAGRAAGIPLERIRAALATLPAHRTPTRRDWERLSRGWREDIDRRIATLEALRNRLTTCIGCGCLSIDACELLNPDDEAAEGGSGAHYLQRDSQRAHSPTSTGAWGRRTSCGRRLGQAFVRLRGAVVSAASAKIVACRRSGTSLFSMYASVPRSCG
jgi:MerR family redox-sensitive transcriptional activator SoxR